MTATRDQDWVTILEAAVLSKVPATTIRDWYHSGAIGSMTTTDGARLVSLPEVKAFAGGEGKHLRSDPKGRLTRTPAQQHTHGETAATLSQAVTELQGMARDRLEPQK
jgi:hypothetical protein